MENKTVTLTADFTSLSKEKAELLRNLLVTLAEMLNLGAYVTIVPERDTFPDPIEWTDEEMEAFGV